MSELTPNSNKRITINWEDGRLRLYAEERLSREDYLQMKEKGFNNKRGETTFFAPYTPSREAFLTEKFGGEIEDDDTDFAEQAQERAEKYEGRADRNYTEYQSRSGTAKKMADAIPFGQPILVGHHSEGRDRRYRARIENNFRKGFEALDKANYWRDRAQSALRRAEQRQTAPAIHRRIEELSAGLRRCQRELERDTAEGRTENLDHWQGWIWFYTHRIDFEKALLDSLPEDQKPDAVQLEKGGAIKVFGDWHVIERVNPKTVSYRSWGTISKRRITDILPAHYMSKADFEAAEKTESRSGGYTIKG